MGVGVSYERGTPVGREQGRQGSKHAVWPCYGAAAACCYLGQHTHGGKEARAGGWSTTSPRGRGRSAPGGSLEGRSGVPLWADIRNYRSHWGRVQGGEIWRGVECSEEADRTH